MKKLQQTMDKITTLISSILCAAMMIILFANVVLRLIPSVGGFKWYMESSQYLNVWSMLIACVGINAMGTNLRVEVVDSIFGRTALGKKLVVLIPVVIGVGLVTPPVGMCIYVACDLMDVKVGDVFPTLIPFLLATFVCIALMIAFPQLITLPTALMRI